MKKKKRRHFRNCAFLFSSGDRNILTLASLGQDGPRGSNKEKPSAFSALFLHFHLLLKACYQRFWKCKKPVITDWLFSCSGDRTRTCDLRVMSPTSSQLLHPAMYFSLLYFNLFSGYSPGERLPKLRDSTPQCIFHCFISILLNSLFEDYKGKRFFLNHQINRVKPVAFGLSHPVFPIGILCLAHANLNLPQGLPLAFDQIDS